MNLLIAIAISSLAGWTVVDLLVFQRGPYAILEKMRARFGSYERDSAPLAVMDRFMALNPQEDPANLPDRFAINELGELFSCPWCMSVWVALVISVAICVSGESYLMLVPIWFAIRSGIMVIERLIRG